MKKTLYGALLLLSCTSPLKAQKSIKILNADVSEIVSSKGQVKLEGHCHFRQEDNDMYCDTLFIYDKTNHLEAIGHIKIIQPEDEEKKGPVVVTADSLHFDMTSKLATLREHVLLVNKGMELTTDFLLYNTTKRIATYEHGGSLTNAQDTLTSQKGLYDAVKDVAEFYNDVRGRTPKDTITSERLTYNNATKTLIINSPTSIKSARENALLYAETGRYNTATQEGVFGPKSYYDSPKNYFRADTIAVQLKDSCMQLTQNAFIRDKERGITSVCDLAKINQIDSTGLLHEHVFVKLDNEGDPFYLSTKQIKAGFDSIEQEGLLPLPKNSKQETQSLDGAVLTTVLPAAFHWQLAFIKSGTKMAPYSLLKAEKVKNPFSNNFPTRVASLRKELEKRSKLYRIKFSQKIVASNGVKIYNTELQLLAEKAVYIKDVGLLYFLGTPILWANNDTQITSEQIVCDIANGELKKIYFLNNPVLLNKDVKLGADRLNTAKGRVMYVTLANKKLSSVKIEGNAESLYYFKSEEEGKKEEISPNHTQASEINICFSNGKIKDIEYTVNVAGKITPWKQVSKPLMEVNTKWMQEFKITSKKDLVPQGASQELLEEVKRL